MRRLSWTCALILLAALARGAFAATETQWWTIDSPGDYAKAESRGVVVRPDGSLEPGPAVSSFADDSLRVAWGIAVLGDGSVAIAGDHGRIDRWSASRGVQPWVRLGSGQVLCLLRDGDGLLAGTGPNGRIYRISPRGDTALVATTGERYVWALAAAGPHAWWAATGTQGRLMRVTQGTAVTVFDSDENNLLCLATDGSGGVYAGGDSKGGIYRVSAAGRARTEYDSAEEEVRALVRSDDGAVWAAALSTSGVTEESLIDDDRPQPIRSGPTGAHAVVYRVAPDSGATAWWTSPQPLLYALVSGRDGVIAASGNRAGVFRIERPLQATQWLAPPEGQMTALATGADGAVWAASSNPVVLWKLGPGPSASGTLTPEPLDARRFARFGHVRLGGSGTVKISTRSGNSGTPDTTWSAWAPLSGSGDEARVASPAARYLQWRAELGSRDAHVDQVAIAWREPNLPPRIDDLSVAPQGQGFREGELGSRSESVTQTLTGGQKVEYSTTTSPNKPIRELPIWARGLRTLQWHGSDPNGDALRYRVEVRRLDGGEWVQIGKDLEASMFTWNTNTLPDGTYRLRVTASDAFSNALGDERTGEALSEPFTIDNTPPTITRLEGAGAEVRGTAEDGQGPLIRLEAAVDDGDWRTLSPEGGMSDARVLNFSTKLPDLAPGEHLVSVRAIDLAGNACTRAIHVQVARTR